MHILIGKKQIVLSALIVMLGLAVFVNWYYTNSGKSLSPEGRSPEKTGSVDGAATFTSAEEAENYFAEMKLARAATEAAALEELEAVMANAEPGSEEAGAASSAIATFTERVRRQSDIESLVSAGIGSPCVAVISENSVDVVLNPASLTEPNVLAVSDIINTVCGGVYENVRISAAVDSFPVNGGETRTDLPVAGDDETVQTAADAAQPGAGTVQTDTGTDANTGAVG